LIFAGILLVVRVAARFLGGLGMRFRRVAGIVVAASPRLVRRHGKETEQEKQCDEANFHSRGKGSVTMGDSVDGIFKTLCQCWWRHAKHNLI
jgi:hypothetical protein